eukprot:TRINITY_DN13743_c0_g2_i1.p1 TRINITY_DN13743_c0_g2~~TRINITY_DN13743_c0_g2_i1.p1  ORF type:complete len:374 (+),score=171.61 TRINITY_DN13743_c0_g2_i1:49-1122(+)
MQILNANVSQLSNFEVRESLDTWREVRGKAQILPSDALFTMEKRLLWTLHGDAHLDRPKHIDPFLRDLRRLCAGYAAPDGGPVRLTAAEELQLLNIKPTSAVQLERIIQELTEDQRVVPDSEDSLKYAIIKLVKIHLKQKKGRAGRDRDDVLCLSSEEEDAAGEAEEPVSPPVFFDPIPDASADALCTPLPAPLGMGYKPWRSNPVRAALPEARPAPSPAKAPQPPAAEDTMADVDMKPIDGDDNGDGEAYASLAAALGGPSQEDAEMSVDAVLDAEAAALDASASPAKAKKPAAKRAKMTKEERAAEAKRKKEEKEQEKERKRQEREKAKAEREAKKAEKAREKEEKERAKAAKKK